VGGKETARQACGQLRRQADTDRQTDIVGGKETAGQACGQPRRQAGRHKQTDRQAQWESRKLLGRHAGRKAVWLANWQSDR